MVHAAGKPNMQLLLLHMLLLLACTHHSAAAPDLSGDIVTSEYLLLTRPSTASLFDCDAWDDNLHVTLQIMSGSTQHPWI
jgi:hypothetical protein